MSGSSLSIFRLVRLCRVSRIVRVCRLEIMKDLMVMIDGALAGLKTFFCASVLVCLPIYSVALICREVLGSVPESHEHGADAFTSVPLAFLTVFRAIVCGDDSDPFGRPVFYRVAMRYGWGYGIFYCSFIMLMSFGLFNVIQAIYVDNVLNAAKFNDKIKLQQRLRDQRFFADKMADLTELIWENFPQHSYSRKSTAIRSSAISILEAATAMEITREDFEQLRTLPNFLRILCDLDVSDEDQIFLFDTLDADASGTISLAELLDGIAKLRGDARRSDVVALTLTMNSVQQELKEYIDEAMVTLRRHDTFFDDLTKSLSAGRNSNERQLLYS